jgi:hypothetical protein
MTRRRSASRAALCRLCAVLTLAAAAAACEASRIVAPSNATVSLSASAATLSFNGTATVTAQVLNGSGAPLDGVTVSFSTTLGTVTPAQAVSAGGVATAVFDAGVTSGTATITASSGSAGGSRAVSIAVGVAAVANVTVAAEPAAVPFGGGPAAITAMVTDRAGNPLSTIPVTFATTSGQIAPASVKTDAKGVAQATLSTSEPAVVTATATRSPSDVGGGGVPTISGTLSVPVTARPRPVVTIAAGNAVALVPVTFTLAVMPAPGTTTAIQSVSIAFVGGGTASLGAVSGANIVAQHVYAAGGTYTVVVTATDTAGGTTTASTVISVGFAAPLSVAVAAGPIVPGASGTSIVTLTATVTPPSMVITRYVWDFGDNSQPQTTTGNQIQHVFTTPGGPYRVTVTVTEAATGQTATGFTIINP